MRVTNPGSSGVTSVTGTAPVTSSGGATPAIGLTPISYWQTPTQDAAAVTIGFTANQTPVMGVPITWPITVGHITFGVSTFDNSANKYDFGLYNAAGTLVANVGAASYTTAGVKTVALAQGTVTLNPGLYYVAMTGNANVLQVTGINNNALLYTFGSSSNAGASVGGALPATITPPAFAVAAGIQMLFAVLAT